MQPTTNEANAPRLLPQHLADLRKSGLTDETILECGFFSESDPAAVAKFLNWKHPAKKLGSCLCIPFIAKTGAPTKSYVRVKPDKPLSKRGKKNETRKYESPIGRPNQAYFPPAAIPSLTDPSVPLFITEGEKKAAKASQEGFPTIGLVGVYGFQVKRKAGVEGEGARALIPDLAAIPFTDRPVYVVYDSDAAENPNVLLAEWHLAETTSAAGAIVKAIRLPAAPDGSKLGLDDFLVMHGADAFRELIATASAPVKPEATAILDDPANPHRLAAAFLESISPKDEPLMLRSHRSEFFRWRVTPQAATRTADTAGQMIPEWDNEAAFWAKLDVTGGAEQVIAGQVRSILSGTITFRVNPGMTATKRVKINGQGLVDAVFNIDAVIPSDGSGFQTAKVMMPPTGSVQ